MNQTSNFNLIENPKAFGFISYTLVFFMMVCCSMITGVLIQTVMPTWSSDIIAGIIVFIVLDRFYMHKRVKTLIPFKRDWAMTYAAQWIVVGLVIKLLLTFPKGADAFLNDISLFTQGELASVLGREFIVTLIFTFLAWNISGQFLGLLDLVGLDQKSYLLELSTPGQREIIPAHQRLANLTLQLGIGLVILTFLTRVHLNAPYNIDGTLKGLKLFSGAEAGALLYFIFGFALLCLSRLISLQTRWNRQRISIASSNINRQWGVYSFVFLLILIVVVSLLPSGDSLGLLSLVGILFGFLARLIIFIGHLIWSLLYLISILPFLLFGRGVPVQNTIPPTPTPPPPEPLAEAVIPPVDPNLVLIRSILLWGALFVIVVFAVTRFVRQHGGLQATLRKLPIASWLFFVWQWVTNNADKVRETLARTIADAWQRIIARTEDRRLFPRPGLLRLSALDPRRQIYFFYLAMIRRGNEQGVERKSSQTPSEYGATLGRVLPAVNEDVRAMTEAFVEARYSPRKINPEEANLVKAAWKRLRSAIQRLRKSNKSK